MLQGQAGAPEQWPAPWEHAGWPGSPAHLPLSEAPLRGGAEVWWNYLLRPLSKGVSCHGTWHARLGRDGYPLLRVSLLGISLGGVRQGQHAMPRAHQ